MALPRVKPGDPITVDVFNALIDAANKAKLNVAQSCGLILTEHPEGYTLGTSFPSFLWAKTTGAISGGTYPFTQQLPAASGTWTAGPLSGVAYETSGSTTVATNTYIKVYRTADGSWRFTASDC